MTLLTSFHLITDINSLRKGMQSYSKSGWQCVGMYAKCQLLSKAFSFNTRGEKVLIRGLLNLQRAGGGSWLLPCCFMRIWLNCLKLRCAICKDRLRLCEKVPSRFFTYIYTHARTHTRTHAHTHTYIYTYIYKIQTHTQMYSNDHPPHHLYVNVSYA